MSAATRAAISAASPTPDEQPLPKPLRLRLRRHVQALDYAGCSRLVARLLEAMGYEEVRPVGRTTFRGYNRPGGGGWDLVATQSAGIGSRLVIIRVKHVPQDHNDVEQDHNDVEPETVHLRSVDELRGACLRAGAAEALLITTGAFSLTVQRQALQDQWDRKHRVAPVWLVDGDELTELLLSYRIGVHEVWRFPSLKPSSATGRLEIDEDIFQELAAHKPVSLKNAESSNHEDRRVHPFWRVSVHISTLREYDARPERRRRGNSRESGGKG